MSGIGVLVFYTEPIFKLSGVSISTSVSTIIFGTVNVVMGAVSPPIINHFGYKRMLIISAVSMIVTHVSMWTGLINFKKHILPYHVLQV